MTIKSYILFILFTLLSQLVFGQRTETALYFNQDTNRLVFETENDVLFKSDHYYTAGIALSYTNKNLKKIKLFSIFLNYFPSCCHTVVTPL